MIIFKIHQIKDIENTDYVFRSFNHNKFNFADYEEKYAMEFESIDDKTDMEICDTIFYVFNMRTPEDFTGHSRSVSDIIELNKHGSSAFYYCNVCGFTKLNKRDMEVKA